MTFDPNDPLADPALAELVALRRLKGADHPWELERPHDFDAVEAVGRFMELARDVEAIVGQSCELEVWPHVREATFHGELVLPADVVSGEGYAAIRASNFGDLIAVLNDDSLVRTDVMQPLRRRFERRRYQFIPSNLLRKTYDGHHRGTKQFPRWTDRLFGYL